MKSQVTINYSELNFSPGPSIELRHLSENSIIRIFEESLNTPGGTWDFTNLEPLEDINYIIRLAVNTSDPYQDASYKFNNKYTLADVVLNAREYEKADELNLARVGLDLDSNFIEMGSLGSNLAIKKQKSDYNPPLIKMTFPLEYNPTETIKSQSVRKIIGLANIPGMGITNAEVIYQVNFSREFNTINWGKVKLYGSVEAIDVLVFHYKEYTLDTVFLNGSILPDFMLEPLGLKQGARNDAEGFVFYGKGYGDYLLNVGKLTNQFGSQSYFGYGLSSLVTDVSDDKQSVLNPTVFPNPSNGIFNLKINKTDDSPWSISIINSSGTLIKSNTITNPAGIISLNISMGNETPDGMYYIKISDALSQAVYTSSIVLIR